MSGILRYKLLNLLENSPTPLNTCQICRIIHGAESKNDMSICQDSKYPIRHDPRVFSNRGNNALYENCKDHFPGYGAVYRHLMILMRKGFLETRKEHRSDPIVPTQKDWMRMWAYHGRLPRMTNFLEESPIMTKHDTGEKID